MEIVECPWCGLKNELRADRKSVDTHGCMHCGGKFNFGIVSPDKIHAYRLAGGSYLLETGYCMLDGKYCATFFRYCISCKKAIEHENKNLWNIERRKEMGWAYNDEQDRYK